MPGHRSNGAEEQHLHIARRPLQKRDQQAPDKRPTHTALSSDGYTAAGAEMGTSQAYPTSLLGDPRLDKRGNTPTAVALMTQVQREYGNRALQRFLQRSSSPASRSQSPLAAPMLSIQRDRGWPDARPGATSSVEQAPPSGSWNKQPVQIGAIWRIPISGLTVGNKRPDEDDVASWDSKNKAKTVTEESSIGRAIVLVPEKLTSDTVDVLLYMHGFGGGYRQRAIARTETHEVKVKVGGKTVKRKVTTVVPGMDAGSVRDVDVDHMERQLQTYIESSGHTMVAVMPQGAYRSQQESPKGVTPHKPYIPSFGAGFNSDAYIQEVFSKTSELSGKKQGRVVLGGHSGAGGTIAPMLEQAVDKEKGKHHGELKTPDQIKKEGGLRLPTGLAEVVLFDAINGPGELGEVEDWAAAQIKHNVQELAGKDPKDQKTYLEGSMRLRAFHSNSDSYTATYKKLREFIKQTITSELKRLKPKLPSDLEVLLRANYHTSGSDPKKDVDPGGVDTGHETLMGTGKVKEALGALQKSPAHGAGSLSVQRDNAKSAGATAKAADDISLTFGPNAVENAVSAHSLEILKDVLRAAGLKSATITSTARTAEDQARAMYNNLEEHGVAPQKALYGPAGDKVIDVYIASKAAKKKPDQIKADMEAKIIEIGPSKVSRHCADFTRLNVFDVGPHSIGDSKANKAFVKAAQAEVGGRISNFIPYPKDPGHHFEIVPNSRTFAAQRLAAQARAKSR